MAALPNVLDTLDREALLVLIHNLYPEWGTPKFDTLTISTANRSILIVGFSTHEARLSVHIPRTYDDDDFCEVWMPLIIAPLKFLKHALPHLPVPKVHSYSLGFEPPANVPFMIFDWIEGTPLQAFTKEWPPTDMRHRILNDLSDFVLDMALCPIAGAKDIWFYGRYPNPSPPFPPTTSNG